MSKKIYNKLVRDRVPEIIRADGLEPKTHILNKEDYLDELIKKLLEEYEEFKADPNVEELADMQEVILALADALRIEHRVLAKKLSEKALKRGQFKQRIYLESVE
jgi:predicted house-cleaning noncanonical NTP pyrophosphatase (MazG superfamily)